MRADVEGSFLDALDLAPGAGGAACGAASGAERFRGTGDLPYFFRKPYGPGWALVGDAGYHKDPITAQGITDAFRDAELLAEAIDAGFAGRRPLEEALAGLRAAAQRARAVRSTSSRYQLAALAAAAAGDAGALRRAPRRPANKRTVSSARSPGPCRSPEFFAPENVEQILGGAAMPRLDAASVSS